MAKSDFCWTLDLCTCNANVDEVIHVLSQPVLHLGGGTVQVVEAEQVAVPDLVDVAVVLDYANRLVEVVGVEARVGVALCLGVEKGSRRPGTCWYKCKMINVVVD